MAATADSPRRTVLWFRNDLRVHDSATVHEAAQRVKAGDSNEVRAPCECRVYNGPTSSLPRCCLLLARKLLRCMSTAPALYALSA